jgi:hypothetical protein
LHVLALVQLPTMHTLLRRILGSLTGLATASLPTIGLWFWLAIAASSTKPSTAPNPAKAPWYFLGPTDVLVYADPGLAGKQMWWWLLPGALLLLALVLWGAGVPVFTQQPAAGWPPPRLPLLALTCFAAGVFLATPWLCALGLVLRGSS